MVTIDKGKIIIEIPAPYPTESLDGMRKTLADLIRLYYSNLHYTPAPDSIAPIIPILRLFTSMEPERRDFESVYTLVNERMQTLEWLFGMDQEKAAKEYWDRLKREEEAKKKDE